MKGPKGSLDKGPKTVCVNTGGVEREFVILGREIDQTNQESVKHSNFAENTPGSSWAHARKDPKRPGRAL